MKELIDPNNKLIFFIFISLIFLATNSILAKLALSSLNIDAFSFTFFRLFSGALFLYLLYIIKNKKIISINYKTNWLSSFMLFSYALAFSYSYLSLDAGLGALILFAVVQLTMILIAIFLKESMNIYKTFGIIIAFLGLFILLYPKEDFSLSFFHVSLMVISGISWAMYTVLGKKSSDSFYDTSDNFIKASLFCILCFIFFMDDLVFDSFSLFLAILSGAITSALGYTLWYGILPKIKIITASILQLLVPLIAIFLSVLFLDEKLTLNLIISTFLILLGVLISLKKTNQNT